MDGTSHAQLESMTNFLVKNGFKAELIRSKDKKDEIFKKIEEKGVINSKIEVLVCTNVIESGINIKNENICLITVVRNVNSFDVDIITRFYEKIRSNIKQAYLIIESYLENLEQEVGLFKSKSSKLISKEYEEISDISTHLRHYCNYANMQACIASLELKKYKIDSDNNVPLFNEKHFVNIPDSGNTTNNTFAYYNVDINDVEIDNKAIINAAYRERNKRIAYYHPFLLTQLFKNKISYERGFLSIDNGVVELPEEPKELTEEQKKEQSLIKEEKKKMELEYRTWFESEKFKNCIDELLSENIDNKDISKYNLEISFEELMEFRKSKTKELYDKLREVFTNEEASIILSSRYKENDKLLTNIDINYLYNLKYIVIRSNSKAHDENSREKYDILYKEFKAKRSIGPLLISTNFINYTAVNLINNCHNDYNDKEFKEIVKKSNINKKETIKMDDERVKVFANILNENNKIKERLYKKINKDLEMMFVIKTKKDRKYRRITSVKKEFNLNENLNQLIQKI